MGAAFWRRCRRKAGSGCVCWGMDKLCSWEGIFKYSKLVWGKERVLNIHFRAEPRMLDMPFCARRTRDKVTIWRLHPVPHFAHFMSKSAAY